MVDIVRHKLASFFLIFQKILFIYGCPGSLWLCGGFSLVEMIRGYSTVTVHRLLIAVASLVTKHGL